ncbi:MAG: efflux RND transporter permease subunit [Pseudomonadota bacterium]
MKGAQSTAGGLPGLSVRRPWLAAVMNLLLVIAGIGALYGLEVRELPNIDRPVVSVRANYPGASPSTVDAEVTSIVESAIARVPGVTSVRSSSEEGNFRIRVEFRPNRDLNIAANDVREAVSRVEARLPTGVEDIYVVKSERDAWPIMQIAVWSETDPIDDLSRIIEKEIVPQLTSVEGIAEVTLFGERERVVRVAVAPEKLSAFGLSIGEVAETLRAAQFDVPVGSFEAGQLEVLVRADASVTDPSRIEALLVRDRVKVGDIAEVYFGLATPVSFARYDGKLVVNLGIVRQSASNTVEIANDVRRVLQQLELRFSNLNFVVTRDDSVFIEGAIVEVVTSLFLALLIVVVVIFLFMGRLSVTLLPAITIPIALVASLSGIYLMGFSINLITLLAMVLATGLVVDDAIVVTENILRRRADGLGPLAAAVKGAQEVFFAVIATTATLVAVFLPISFLPSEAGRMFSEFGFVLALTVMISSFVSLTMCPMLASLLSSANDGAGARNGVGRVLADLYGFALRPFLAAPLVALTLFGVVAMAALVVYTDVGQELVPPEDRGQVNVRLQGPDGTGLDFTDRQVAAVEEMLVEWVDAGIAKGLHSITGRWDLNRGQISAQLVPWQDREISQAEIEAALAPGLAALPGARARTVSGNSLGLRGSGGGGVSLALTGPTYPQIAEAAFDFAPRLAEIEGLSRPRVQYQATQPQLSIDIDREVAADLGVSMDELSGTLRALVDEDEVAELTIDDQAVPVIVQSSAGAVRDPADLLNLSVRSETGALVPLLQVVTFREEGVAAELDRHGQRRAIEIDLNLDPALTMQEAVDQIRALANAGLPDGIGLLFLGEAATLEETSSGLLVTFLIAFVVVFLVLVAQFESATSALIIMVTVPFGICAAIFALWITGTTINIYSQIGVLMLVGIMAKNGILLVEFADQLRDRGASVWEAAEGAARTRLRPIAMTLASTVFAAVPLIVSSGPGAEARSAIGWVIFGGLGIAALITLFLTPAVYALLAGLSAPRNVKTVALDAELTDAEQTTAGAGSSAG